MTRRELFLAAAAVLTASTVAIAEPEEGNAMATVTIDKITIVAGNPGDGDPGSILVEGRTATGVKIAFSVSRTDPVMGPTATTLCNQAKTKAQALLV